MTVESLVARVDGAARGNPGPAGIGVVLEDPDGNVVKEIAEPLGRTTNNVAEYSALIRALEEARALGCSRITVYTDSELMARQISGQYRVKTEHIIPLFERVRILQSYFDRITVTHVRRELNKHADKLSNLGADRVDKPSKEPLEPEPDEKVDEGVVIQVRENGPYKITGQVTLVDHNGEPIAITEGKPGIVLCRCGLSSTKPFCDATHKREGWCARLVKEVN